MNNINEIFDAWKKFTKFLGIADEKPKKEYKEDLGLILDTGDDNVLLILYTPVIDQEKKSIKFNVIGGIFITGTKKPCIGPTMQVSNVYVDDDFRGQGFGPLIYGFAFLLAQQGGFHLTSDQKVGSEEGAVGRWDKLISRGEIQNQKTDAGNEVFDYTGKETPDDPQDDCEKPTKKTATNQSWVMKNANKYKKYLNNFFRNHIIYLDKMSQISPSYDLEGELTQEFVEEFEIKYRKITGK